MSTHIEWVSVDDRYPVLTDKVTSVLFVWDFEVFDGWPVDEEEHIWEANGGCGGCRTSVTHWAYFNLPGEPTSRGEER